MEFITNSSWISDLKAILPLANSHMVNFITDEMFEKVLSRDIQNEISGLNCTTNFTELVLHFIANGTNECSIAPNLFTFLKKARNLTLKENNLCITLEELCQYLQSAHSKKVNFEEVRSFMSLKKSHEVEIMSGIVSSIAKAHNCTHIVDIGGGKGYLGSVLAYKHYLNVLSIDSSYTTCTEAVRRIPKVEKSWSCHKQNGSSTERILLMSEQDKTNSSQGNSYKKLYQVENGYIKEDTDAVKLIKDRFNCDKVEKIMLVGLHTCGNLASTSLRLFVNNPHHVQCLVNVGCCYHLIVEEFEPVLSWLEGEMEASGFGFPMSTYFRNMKLSLGRNARMLAAQSIDRLLHTGKLQMQTEHLFYRALLELYLQNKLKTGTLRQKFRVGKLVGKCTSFVEYVHKSLKRLKLDIRVDDEELQQLYDSHEGNKWKLHAFFLLRLAVAPVIEAAIMLDKLLFLHEKGIEDVYLTQLFDPVVSPRCYAIIAFNNKFRQN